jgi:hypothetical protein
MKNLGVDRRKIFKVRLRELGFRKYSVKNVIDLGEGWNQWCDSVNMVKNRMRMIGLLPDRLQSFLGKLCPLRLLLRPYKTCSLTVKSIKLQNNRTFPYGRYVVECSTSTRDKVFNT